MVVQRDETQGAGGCLGEKRRRSLELTRPEAAPLLAPRTNGAQADDD
jgi:hypothetical protein